jgi:hypothetical protein
MSVITAAVADFARMPRQLDDRGNRLGDRDEHISGIGPSDAFWHRAAAGVSDLDFACPWALRMSGVRVLKVSPIVSTIRSVHLELGQ